MGRTVIVGDVHGCREELERLLAHVGFGGDDRLVLVGDLVVRGPDPAGVVDLAIRLGAQSVRGNHEDRLLRYMTSRDKPPIGAMTRATAQALKRRHWDYLASLPLFLELPSHGLYVVHAGVVPGVPIPEQSPRHLMYMRTLDQNLEPHEQRELSHDRRLWGQSYEGPPHVVFGHNARQEVQVHRYATGLDTSCVYGGKLTAMVLRQGERPPPERDRLSAIVSVPARRAYVQHG